MRRLLDLMVVEGIKTTIPVLRRIISDTDFLQGRISTHYLERLLAGGKPVAAHS